jgi:cytochrome c2
VNRKAGTYPGYGYSPATRNSGLVWDPQTLAKYLRSPRDLVPGTRMAFAGLKKDRELTDVIAYLAQFDADGSQSKRSALDLGRLQGAGKAEAGKIAK